MNLTLSLNLSGCKAIVVGGGKVATRKSKMLIAAEIVLTVIAPELTPELSKLVDEGKIRWICKRYETGDLHGATLAIAATSDKVANLIVAKDARKHGILVNVVDAPNEGTVNFPAQFNRGSLQVAVSTSGRSPAFATAIRDELAEIVGDHYGLALELLTDLREKLLTARQMDTYNSSLIKELIASGLLEYLKTNNLDAAKKLIDKLAHADNSND